MKRQRRILTKAIGTGSVKAYEPILDGQSRDFVHNLTKPAMDFRKALLQLVQFPSRSLVTWEQATDFIYRYNAGLTLMVLYGHKATSEDDRFMKLAAESTEVLSNKLVTGGGVWAVDIFPFCEPSIGNVDVVSHDRNLAVRHLPSWFPGAGFKRSAVEWKKLIEAFVNEPHEDCKQKIVSRLPWRRPPPPPPLAC